MPSLGDAVSVYRQEGGVELLRRGRRWLGSELIQRLEGPKEGVAVVEEDWDTLVVLDACRYDAFEKVNTLPGTLERRTSRSSVTWSFLRENFEGRTLHDTIYVAGNAVVGDNADALDVYKLVGLWGDDGDERSPVLPEEVVERTLELHEAHPDKRLVVHFLQPHTPFVVDDGRNIPPDSKLRNFDAARVGDVSPAEIRDVYEENLAYVLEHVADLVAELDGRTVVTADHGELLGEGIPALYELLHPRWPVWKRGHFDYAHYSHVRVPELVEIPWLVIDDDERREITADEPAGAEFETESIEDRLEALGYRA